MAETKLSLSIADVVLTFADDTGTPLTYAPNFMDGGGTISWTEHYAEPVESTDQNGNALSKRDGARSGRSEVTLTNCTVRDLGKHATDVTLMDILLQTGVVGSTWVSVSGTGADGATAIPELDAGERKRFHLIAVVANRGASGAIKGHTVQWDSVDAVPGWSVEWTNGTCKINSLTLRSTQMSPFKTRTT
jgi:hypothetical protein